MFVKFFIYNKIKQSCHHEDGKILKIPSRFSHLGGCQDQKQWTDDRLLSLHWIVGFYAVL